MNSINDEIFFNNNKDEYLRILWQNMDEDLYYEIFGMDNSDIIKKCCLKIENEEKITMTDILV